MTDSVYAPPKADLTKHQSDDTTEAFYVVSTMKMMVLFIATLGATSCTGITRTGAITSSKVLLKAAPTATSGHGRA